MVPLTTLPVTIVVAPPVPPVPPPVVMMVPPVPDKEVDGSRVTIADLDSDDEDRYRDIDGAAIEVGQPMPKARPNDMQVTSAHAKK